VLYEQGTNPAPNRKLFVLPDPGFAQARADLETSVTLHFIPLTDIQHRQSCLEASLS